MVGGNCQADIIWLPKRRHYGCIAVEILHFQACWGRINADIFIKQRAQNTGTRNRTRMQVCPCGRAQPPEVESQPASTANLSLYRSRRHWRMRRFIEIFFLEVEEKRNILREFVYSYPHSSAHNMIYTS
jgi:hypothetical protein